LARLQLGCAEPVRQQMANNKHSKEGASEIALHVNNRPQNEPKEASRGPLGAELLEELCNPASTKG
jgi:hypothetical protein